MRSSWLVFALGIFYFSGVQSIRCLQGFNVSLLGIPLSVWEKGICPNAHCFMQEMTFPFFDTEYKVGLRLGGCIPSGKEDLITCEKLFGRDSDLKLVQILDILPGFDRFYSSISFEFSTVNIFESYRNLFSNGNGMETFVSGSYTLLENLGLKMANANPLKDKIVDFMNAVLPWDPSSSKEKFNKAKEDVVVKSFLDDLRGVLDAYQVDYPKSEIPAITWKFARFVNASYHLGYRDYCQYNIACMKQFDKMLPVINSQAIDAAVDLQFAIDEELNFDSLDLFEEIQKALPDFTPLIRFWRVFDRDDFKQLYKDVYKYAFMVARNRYAKYGFFAKIKMAFSPTLERVEAKFKNFFEKLKERLAPDTCKSMSCKAAMTGFCNEHDELTKMPTMIKQEDGSFLSYAATYCSNVLLIVASVLLLRNII